MSPIIAMLALAAIGWLIAAAAMAALWRWHLRLEKPRLAEAVSPLITAALAVVYANLGGGMSVRRSAIAWMLGSWGARLGVYLLWDDVFEQPADSRIREPLAHFERHAIEAVFFAMPSLLMSFDRAPTLSTVELAAAGTWLVGFAGETTADRQFVRWRRERAAGRPLPSEPAADGTDALDHSICRAGVWRYVPRAHDVFELVTWTAHAAFVWAAPHGWLAMACPIAVAYRAAIAGTRRAQIR